MSSRLDFDLDRFDTLAQDAGIDPALLEPRESLFSKVLNTIDKPKQIIQGILDTTFLRGDLEHQSSGGLFSDIIAAGERGLEERSNAFDILRREGVENPILRGIAGFAGEIVTDPLNLIGVGFAKNVPSAGGRMLTKTGQKTFKEIREKFLQTYSKDMGEVAAKELAESAADDAMRSASNYLKAASRAQGPEAAAFAKQLEDAEYAVKAAGIENLDELGALFKEKSVNIDLGIPLLGHFSKDAKYKPVFEKGQGLIPSTFAAISNIVKPGTLDIAEIPLSKITKPLGVAADNTGFTAMYKVAKDISGKALDKVTKIPGIKETSKLAKEVGTTLKRTFARKLLTGQEFANLNQDMMGELAGAPLLAQDRVLNRFGDLFVEGADNTKVIEALNGLDGIARASSIHLKSKDSALLDVVNKVASGAEQIDLGRGAVPEELSKKADLAFGQLLQKTIEMHPDREVAENMQRIHDFMQELRKEEHALGIKTGFVEGYIPHRYTNAKKTGSFTEGRKYSSLSEAFADSGLMADLNPADLLYQRAKSSFRSRASRKYFQRLVMERGLPLDKYAQLLRESAFDPEAAAVLKREGFATPSARNLEEIVKNQAWGQDSLIPVTRAVEALQEEGVEVKHITEGLMEAFGDVRKLDSEIAKLQMSVGYIPGDTALPNRILGELGESVVDLDGTKHVLPIEMARAFNETVTNRDYLRSALSGSELGSKMLDYHDAALNFTKTLTTLPFPSYWMRNLFGDAMFRAMDGGIAALDPGYITDMARLAKGETIRLRSGQLLDGRSWQEFLKKNGIKLSDAEMLDMVGTAGGLNMDKVVRKSQMAKNGIVKSLGKTARNEPKRILEDGKMALSVASERMRDNFEQSFRAGHVLHHLHNGSSMMDALRRTNEALINYRDLSAVERSFFRRSFFFYNWVSKATKKTLNSMVTNPGDLQMQIKAARGVAETFSAPDAAPSYEEFEQKSLESLTALEQISFPLGRDKEGKPVTGRGFGLPLNVVLESFSAYAPRNASVGELINTVGDSSTRTIQKLLSASNPGLKVIAETVADKNLFFNQPFSAQFLRKVPSFAGTAEELAKHPYTAIPGAILDGADKSLKYLLDAVPDGKGNYIADPGKYYLMVNLFPPIARTVGTLRDLTDEDLSWSQSLAQTFSGIRIEEQDFERSAKFQRRNEMQKTLERYSADQRAAENANSF